MYLVLGYVKAHTYIRTAVTRRCSINPNTYNNSKFAFDINLRLFVLLRMLFSVGGYTIWWFYAFKRLQYIPMPLNCDVCLGDMEFVWCGNLQSHCCYSSDMRMLILLNGCVQKCFALFWFICKWWFFLLFCFHFLVVVVWYVLICWVTL